MTDSCVQLYTTIVRFDIAYHHNFKCNLKMIRYDYPNLDRWLRNLYWNYPAFKDTTRSVFTCHDFSLRDVDMESVSITFGTVTSTCGRSIRMELYPLDPSRSSGHRWRMHERYFFIPLICRNVAGYTREHGICIICFTIALWSTQSRPTSTILSP